MEDLILQLQIYYLKRTEKKSSNSCNNSEKLANDTLKEVQKQSKKLNRFKTIEKVLKNSKIILLDNEDELIKFSNFMVQSI